MDSIIVRVLGGLVLFAAFFGIRYCNGTERRADASKEVLVAAREMIKDVPGYNEDPSYMDWLVERGHKEVFNDSYTIDTSRRRYTGGGDTVDLDKYGEALFNWMIARARSDQRLKVAENIENYLNSPEPGEEAEEPKEPENPFVKK
ncbi:MAG TPA: hypothetical protein VK176_09520 [Phycisphaerales bacterium]|nr:hypothetical protein [Phycisphaerales bacterium]